MTIVVNGTKYSADAPLTVAGLLAEMGYRMDRIAVEVNEEMVPKAQYETCVLKENDRVEVVTFVGGG